MRRLDRHRPASRHRVARVDREIDDHLLELSRIGADRTELGVEHRQQLDVLADQAPQHHVHVGDDGVEVEHPGLQDLPAAEREQLPGERRGARGGLLDLLGVASQARVVLAGDEELAVAGDGGQQVVEVVRDATGEPADRFHLLGLAELVLELLLQRQVTDDRDVPARPDVRGRGELDQAHRLRRAGAASPRPPPSPTSMKESHSSATAVSGRRSSTVSPSSFVVRDTEQLGAGLIEVDDATCVVRDQRRNDGALERRREEQVRFPLSRDVLHVRHDMRRLPVVTGHE